MPASSSAAVEQLSGGAHERLSRDVLLVAGLLADEQHLGASRALAEHRLRRVR